MPIGYGAYDGFSSTTMQQSAKIARKNTAVVPERLIKCQGLAPHAHLHNPHLHGWASDAASKVGLSLWEYFKPMIPWFIVSNLITAIVIWKVASLFCSGRLAWSSAKTSLRSGVRSIGDLGRKAKAKVGIKR